MLTPDEKERRNYAEFLVFKYNILLKSLSVGMFLYFLSRRRLRNPNYLYDALIFYGSSYAFILSHVIGVHLAWPEYQSMAKKVIKSK